MKKFLFFLVLFAAWSVQSFGQNGRFSTAPNYESILKRLQSGGDTTFVLNFWATWCKPCVEELPVFEDFHAQNQNKPVRVLLISLDFKTQIDKKVLPFLMDRKIQSEVIVLTDTDAEHWIPKVDATWDGAIPATLVWKAGKVRFVRDDFDSVEALERFVKL